MGAPVAGSEAATGAPASMSGSLVSTAAVSPDNRPTPLAGRNNGRLEVADLVRVEPGCHAARAAAPSLGALLAAARADGVSLLAGECYRPYDDQASARTNACTGGNCACAGKPGGSMHGWAKAVDFRDARGSITSFSSPGYLWLRANAGRFGWNHPGWAAPGGGPCPEPWHWEWVGDGGTLGADPIRADVVGLMSSPAGGYWTVTGLGTVEARAGAASHGTAATLPLARLVVGAAATPSGAGYRLVGSDGGVFAFGDAGFLGSTGSLSLNQSIVGMAATSSGSGYWFVGSDGGIFAFGDAGFYGSTGSLRLNRPITGMAATPSGRGYWCVASDGGIFAFGDAGFFGSAPARAAQITGIGATATGRGYRIVAIGGGVAAFGDASP